MEKTVRRPPGDSLTRLALLAGAEPAKRASRQRVACFHCGEPCPDETLAKGEKVFCCRGCLVVHDLLAEAGMAQFYDLSRHPGVRVHQPAARARWAFLDEPSVRERLLDFTDGSTCRVTFHIPAIHCIACVWLLENLYRLHPGIGACRVNFPRREVAITFAAEKIALSELVYLLASIGYEPRLTLGELEKRRVDPTRKRRWLQLGIAGFAFGNIMLFSLPGYLGLDSFHQPLFKALFGYLSLALALPAVVYSAADYWRSALLSLRQRALTLDVPIALGLAALYLQSAGEILSGQGAGYLDSLAGLVFFLLCGRAFQQQSYERIVFDRDYRCFFPLSVVRKTGAGEASIAISDLAVGDRLVLRNGELIPADCRLLNGPTLVDYSFVTGEAVPVTRQAGDYLYAGGKQIGSVIEVETVKPVSQSYLTSLWGHEAFSKERRDRLKTLTNRYSRRFTQLVIAISVGAALFWIATGDPARGLKAFTSVLIVACPCALALAAPFALGTAQRLLARTQVFLKNAVILERLADVDTIVFDKTGTLTSSGTDAASFQPFQRALSDVEQGWVWSLARHSTHPQSVHIAAALSGGAAFAPGGESNGANPLAFSGSNPRPANATVAGYVEIPGSGIEGRVDGHPIQLGSRAWLEECGLAVPAVALPPGNVAYLAVDCVVRGVFVLASALRPNTGPLLRELGDGYKLALLSGDNEREKHLFQELFGAHAHLCFNQSPLDKLGFISELQDAGRTVMMVGDGLNDAGALQQSDVGVAVVDKIGTFSPASDVILEAGRVPELPRVLALGRGAARVVRLSFALSACYNLVGVSVAAAGLLSPVICAVLMPLSSVSVALFACGAVNYAARKLGLAPANGTSQVF